MKKGIYPSCMLILLLFLQLFRFLAKLFCLGFFEPYMLWFRNSLDNTFFILVYTLTDNLLLFPIGLIVKNVFQLI